MHVYFTTVKRGAPVELGGELVRLDWSTKTVAAARPIAPSNPSVVDPNPRGNARGGRGIVRVGGELIVASYHTLHVYGPDLEHRRDVSHGLLAGIHETEPTAQGTVWVASTMVDAALELELATGRIVRALWPREMPALKRRWGLTPLPIDKQADNRRRYLGSEHARHASHLHLNAVALWRGRTCALFNRFGAIVNLDTAEVLIEDGTLSGGHNLRIEEGGTAFVNDTRHRAVRVYDLNARSLRATIPLTEFAPVRALEQRFRGAGSVGRWLTRLGLRGRVATPIFVRGLDRVGDYLYVGMSPAAIACIHLPTGELADFYQYSQDVGVCIHGIQVVPSWQVAHDSRPVASRAA